MRNLVPLLFALSLLIPVSYAQPSPYLPRVPFKVVIEDLAGPQFTCTVFTSDSRIRREVASFHGASLYKVVAYEAPAEKDDIQRVEAMLASPQFVAWKTPPGRPTVLGQDSHLWTVIDPKYRAHGFVEDGKGGFPEAGKVFRDFAKEIEKRKLPKLSGKPELICTIPVISVLKVTHATE